MKNIKNEMRLINAYLKVNNLNKCEIDKIKKRYSQLSLIKKKYINNIIYLKTAYIMIDKMFTQEILNAQLRKKYFINFFFYDCFPLCIHKLFKYCNCNIDCCLPKNFKSDPVDGTLLEEILNLSQTNSINNLNIINVEEIESYHIKKNSNNNCNNNLNFYNKFLRRNSIPATLYL